MSTRKRTRTRISRAHLRAILSPAYLAYVLGDAPRPHIPA